MHILFLAVSREFVEKVIVQCQNSNICLRYHIEQEFLLEKNGILSNDVALAELVDDVWFSEIVVDFEFDNTINYKYHLFTLLTNFGTTLGHFCCLGGDF